MKITGAIFDADGTLFDSMFVWEGLIENFLISKGIKPDEKISEEARKMYLKESVSFLSEKHNLDNSGDKVYEDMIKFLGDLYKNALPKDGVLEFLKLLESKNVKMCIATSSEKSLIKKMLINNSLDRFFEFIITSDEVGSSKHSPKIFNDAAEILGTNKASTYVFEDTAFAAETAKKAGFNVCGIFDAHEKNQNLLIKNSDIYIKSFYELL